MRIGVLRGGPSSNYDQSLKTGDFVLSLLREEPEKYNPVDIFISKEGDWHISGRKYEPHQALRHLDLVWNALHGEYGEDGQMNQLLSNLQIPHTGSTTFGLAIAINKDLAKHAYKSNGLLTPQHEVLLGDVSVSDLLRVFRTYLHPVMIKPVKNKSFSGIIKAHSFEELKSGVVEAFKYSSRVIVEEFIGGIDASCGVLENFRKDKLYALIPTPNNWKSETNKQIESMAKAAHSTLGLRHYSSSNFIITPKGKVYILETNALPELTSDSFLPKSLASVGVTPQEFVNHIVSLAI